MSSLYPGALDNLSDVTSGQTITAAIENSQTDAINAIETALGTNPFGSYSTVAAAISGKSDANYVSDSGTANAYAVTLSPVPGSYTAGMRLTFNAAHANTGASTLNVNSLGTKSIKKTGGSALESGDIASGQLITVVYDGTNFQIVNSLQLSPAAVLATGVTATTQSVGNDGTAVATTAYADRECPRGAFSNLAHNNSGTTTIAVTYDSLTLWNGSIACVVTGGSFTNTNTTTGANGLDTGSIAASTWYYLWIIAKPDGTSPTSLISITTTYGSLSFPTGYSGGFGKLIGAVKTDSSKHWLTYYQYGETVWYNTPQTVINAYTNTTKASGSWYSNADMTTNPTNYVPSSAVAVQISILLDNSAGSGQELLVGMDGANAFQTFILGSATSWNGGSLVMPYISQKIYFAPQNNGANAWTYYMYIQGFKLNL